MQICSQKSCTCAPPLPLLPQACNSAVLLASIVQALVVMENKSFSDLGLCKPLLETLSQLKYTTPTQIQFECIGPALEGRDIIGLAPTGSGKTAAFALPILQHLWDNPQGLFALVLSPTRELAYQISAQFEALGVSMGVRATVIVGGDDDRVQQAVMLAKRPHIIVATPGRLHDHLKATKGFNLRSLKHLVCCISHHPPVYSAYCCFTGSR